MLLWSPGCGGSAQRQVVPVGGRWEGSGRQEGEGAELGKASVGRAIHGNWPLGTILVGSGHRAAQAAMGLTIGRFRARVLLWCVSEVRAGGLVCVRQVGSPMSCSRADPAGGPQGCHDVINYGEQKVSLIHALRPPRPNHTHPSTLTLAHLPLVWLVHTWTHAGTCAPLTRASQGPCSRPLPTIFGAMLGLV